MIPNFNFCLINSVLQNSWANSHNAITKDLTFQWRRERERREAPRISWIFGTDWSIGPIRIQQRCARHLDHRTYAGFRSRQRIRLRRCRQRRRPHWSTNAPQRVSVLPKQQRTIPRRHRSQMLNPIRILVTRISGVRLDRFSLPLRSEAIDLNRIAVSS